ncbi:MAG TPA: hypothetical protein DDZ96_09235 [Porphyromonadaceae bacterium]|mgnify:CR=1 FL=1|jgi:hypothetical protein|uniref:porin family protein n=1 Tax=Limibacterium fermenti TaxID=3229863 RepID=UPI000E97D334|nr:hypothetical protein [Porphyromonadaceae bacterium]HBK30853.1 hypothetical protein [Porphyromonadaceae bacterium]HBL33979.1 hypothetical protein [Porphyromonadaceae bacterium]HBX19616.1 hypothetical protein [Porphyromonadaceae bacterium]HBX46951.1 hypothetical protein [Porphyromonadaceae bacterium]
MKKIMLSLALMVGLGTATQVSAQKVDLGVKADANMSNFILSDLDNVESNLGFGASLGGFAKINFTDHFALQPELLFHFKTSEIKNNPAGNSFEDYQYFGAEIPVYAVGQMNLGSGTGYIGVGPYVGLGFDARYKSDNDNAEDLKLYKEYDNKKSALQRFDFGAGIMIGYEFEAGIQINAGYKIGVIDALNAGKDDATMLPQTISLGLGYRF